MTYHDALASKNVRELWMFLPGTPLGQKFLSGMKIIVWDENNCPGRKLPTGET